MKKPGWRTNARRVSILVLVSKIWMYWNEMWSLVLVDDWISFSHSLTFSPPLTYQIHTTNDMIQNRGNVVCVCKEEASWCREQRNLQPKQKLNKRGINAAILENKWNSQWNILWNKTIMKGTPFQYKIIVSSHWNYLLKLCCISVFCVPFEWNMYDFFSISG